MKQMESQLKQVTVAMADMQIRMGTLKTSVDSMVERRIEGAMERWCEQSRDQHNRLQDQMHKQNQQLWDQMQQFMVMLPSQIPVRLSPKFPPRERSKPRLPRNGVADDSKGSSEFEVEPPVVGENNVERRQGALAIPNQSGFPMLKMEIPLFDGQNPRWWVRRCEVCLASIMWPNSIK